jgi:hypothetical protein
VFSIVTKGQTIFAGTDAGLFRSSDNGGTWVDLSTNFPLPFYIYALALKGNALYAGTDFAGAWMSTDDGTTWTEITFDLSMISAVYTILSINNVVLIGTDNGVFSTTDNGVTWQDLSDGLPDGAGVLAFGVSGSRMIIGTDALGVWYRPLSDITTAVDATPAVDGLTLSAAYPNPARDVSSVHFTYTLQARTSVRMALYDAAGKQIETIFETIGDPGSHEIRVPTQNLLTGTYFCTLVTEKGTLTRSFKILR